jgi:hypothetical protein
LSCQKLLIVYHATVLLCRRVLEKRDRTIDQMIRAARRCKQNITEGSMTSETSEEMELKLRNVARATPEKLLDDDHDPSEITEVTFRGQQS